MPDLPETVEPRYAFLVIQVLLLVGWIAWWLLCVNWKKAWQVLGEGAWTGLVLLTLLSALAWSQIAPCYGTLFEMGRFPNFWWQLGTVTSLVALALFCGWLQGVFGIAVLEVDVEPMAAGDHDNDHGHEHDASHGHATNPEGHGHGH